MIKIDKPLAPFTSNKRFVANISNEKVDITTQLTEINIKHYKGIL